MEVVIPNGNQVHITIGQPPLLALPHETRAVAVPSERPRGRIAKGLLAGFVLVGAFQAGRFLPHRAETAAAQLATGPAGTGATESGGGIPPAFRAQMGQPPQVVPPPGAAPAGTAGGSSGNAAAPAAAPASANPFGLQG